MPDVNRDALKTDLLPIKELTKFHQLPQYWAKKPYT